MGEESAGTSRESDEDAEERKGKKQTQIQNRRKRFETDEHRPSNHHAFNVAAASSSPGLFSSPLACICFLCVCIVQVNFNSLEQ